MLAQAEVFGLDFPAGGVVLKDVAAENPFQRKGFGTLEGVGVGPLRFTFSVNSDRKSKAGATISGDYILTSGDVRRGATRWYIEDTIRWERFPEGVLGEKELAELNFENYVAEHGTLPPGTAVPDVAFVRLDNGARCKLSDFRSKVVVLDWWATWCGPCQEPLAELQKLLGQHSEWKGRVEVVSLSIDDEARQAREHLTKRGWTNTFNAWAGPERWASAPAKQFRVSGVPTCYIIDAQGKVVAAGHPMALQLEDLVSPLLR